MELAYGVLLLDLFDLGFHRSVVAGCFHVADDTESDRHTIIRVTHHCEEMVQRYVLLILIVHEYVIEGVTVFAYRNGTKLETFQYDSFIAIGTEDHLLAMTQRDGTVGTNILV